MASVIDPTHTQPSAITTRPTRPSLEQGERLDRETFHARYSAMHPDVRAELIEGVVHVPSPLGFDHGSVDFEVHYWLGHYKAATSGVSAAANATTRMGAASEVQPDASLMIVGGGDAAVRLADDGYLDGAPELVVEIASSSASFDLYDKKDLYERYGVREYLVVLTREPQVLWFIRRGDKFEELAPGGDSVFRSEVFPGLWLDPAALLQGNSARVREVVEQGLATAEHADFVQRLESAQAG